MCYLVAQRGRYTVKLVLGVAAFGGRQAFFVAWPPLRRCRVDAVCEVLASAVLAANWFWLPSVAQVGPDAGSFPVACPVLTVSNVPEWQVQLEHELSRL